MSRSVLIPDLSTWHRVYEPEGKAPAMAAETEDREIARGDEVVATDGTGNSVRCTVRRRLLEVVPDWETYSTGPSKGQEALL